MDPTATPSSTLSTQSSFVYKPTTEAYDAWAAVYDTDGNFLQALDTLAVRDVLPRFIASLPSAPKIVDLGCGTGRTTVPLLSIRGAAILGLDSSPGMLKIARERCMEMWESIEGPKAESVRLEEWDIFSPQATGVSGSITGLRGSADAVVSTLVLEHIPLSDFFAACADIMVPGGMLLLTNMHADMGAVSQAGFRDPKTGEKIRPVSYAHTVEDLLEEASKWGFEVVGQVEEREVRGEDDVAVLGERARKWIGLKVWFGIIMVKKG
ncbi:MAG: hypothetical protein LQ351_008107 [Letrouitia transgressa]|nr:MAG: hypothetical protein LQ351_008107 [Letrouitia transgressa]